MRAPRRGAPTLGRVLARVDVGDEGVETPRRFLEPSRWTRRTRGERTPAHRRPRPPSGPRACPRAVPGRSRCSSASRPVTATPRRPRTGRTHQPASRSRGVHRCVTSPQIRSRRRRYSSSMSVTHCCGPPSAATTAFCVIEQTLLVEWLWIALHAETTAFDRQQPAAAPPGHGVRLGRRSGQDRVVPHPLGQHPRQVVRHRVVDQLFVTEVEDDPQAPCRRPRRRSPPSPLR